MERLFFIRTSFVEDCCAVWSGLSVVISNSYMFPYFEGQTSSAFAIRITLSVARWVGFYFFKNELRFPQILLFVRYRSIANEG